jgi:hypothetical protein
MKTTWYFREQVLRKRPYTQRAWHEPVVSSPMARVVRPHGGFDFGECRNQAAEHFEL